MSGELEGKVAVITGANTGIGKVTALELANRGAEVVLACRSAAKAEPVVEELKQATGNQAVSFERLDLGDLAQVREAAKAILARDRPIHMLINNAGLAGQQGLTSDGFELAFGVNHLGHFLWTKLLLDKVVASAPARIVNVSSIAHFKATGFDWDAARQPTKTVTGLVEYQRSKLANVLHAKSLARQLKDTGVTTYSLHPGVVASDVWRRVPPPFRWLMKLFMISNEEGAQTTLHCATAESVAKHSGRYYDNSREVEPSELSHNMVLADELWERSEAWVSSSPAKA